jgi:hypothetical protein
VLDIRGAWNRGRSSRVSYSAKLNATDVAPESPLVVDVLDERQMSEVGEQPVNQVIADLNALGEGEIYKLVAPFMPAPLVPKASSLGISHWVTQGEEQESVIYFCRE